MRGRRYWLVVELVIFLGAFAVFVTRVPTIDHYLRDPDHGYQLAAGQEFLRGHLPGVQSLTNYGPLVAITTGIALRSSGKLAAEAMMCALGWATAVWLACRVVARHFGGVAGIASAMGAFAGVARFHKWYVWLVPLLALAARPDPGRENARRRWCIVGLICGIGALFRPEFGIAAFVVSATMLLADSFRARPVDWFATCAWLVIGFVLPALAWGATVLALTGWSGVSKAVRVVLEGWVGSVTYWSKAPPSFRIATPFTQDSVHALALYLLPAIEAVAIVVGGWFAYFERRGRLPLQGRALAAMGLMGLACYPHARYRAGIHHLWQGIWPLALIVPAFCALALADARSRLGERERRRAYTRVIATFSLATAIALVLTPILRLPNYDLAPYGRAPFAGLAELHRGLAGADTYPFAPLCLAINRLTVPTDEIMIVLNAPQLYYFADRAPSGFVVAYQRGLFDGPQWRAQHLAELQHHPPALLVAPAGFEEPGTGNTFRASQPEMYEYLVAHYRARQRYGSLMLLMRE